MLMQAGEAREWFHDVSPGEENLPFLWQPVDRLHAELGLTALCPLCWLGAAVLALVLDKTAMWLSSQCINLKENYFFLSLVDQPSVELAVQPTITKSKCRRGSGSVLLGPGTRRERREMALLWAVNYHEIGVYPIKLHCKIAYIPQSRRPT